MKSIFKLIIWFYFKLLKTPSNLLALLKILLSFKSTINALSDLLWHFSSILLKLVYKLRIFAGNNPTLTTVLFIFLHYLRDKFKLPIIFKSILTFLHVMTYFALINAFLDENTLNLKVFITFIKDLYENLENNFINCIDNIKKIFSYLYDILCSIFQGQSDIGSSVPTGDNISNNDVNSITVYSVEDNNPKGGSNNGDTLITALAVTGAILCCIGLLYLIDPETTSDIGKILYYKCSDTSVAVYNSTYKGLVYTGQTIYDWTIG
uniref:hypothetical protein n=1 Tax=Elmerina hispida TaxID=1245649 RepID=UPI0030029B83|nr:hypothetical protein [Elmerina hispida]